MYGSSTQLNSWTFKSEQDLQALRVEANKNYTEKFKAEQSNDENFHLTLEEELQLEHYYVRQLRDFCHQYRDPRDDRIRLPLGVACTATHYFKRFYLYNSVMDYHPKEIMHTCIYLACKIEEFHVTITDYVHNVEGNDEHKEMIATSILNSELQTTQELQFHLIVHQPYRPVEGLMIDLKTRYPDVGDAECLRGAVDEFLERAHLTDAILLYAPSQLAVAAVTTAASKMELNLDKYVTDILFGSNPNMLSKIIDAVRKIKRYVKSADNRSAPRFSAELEEKLSRCRNPLNDPSTKEYKLKQARLEQDDEDFPLTSCNADTEDSLLFRDDITDLPQPNGSGSVGADENESNDRSTRGAHITTAPSALPAHWAPDHEDFDVAQSVGGVTGVGLGMHRQVLDGGVIDDDDDCVMEDIAS